MNLTDPHGPMSPYGRFGSTFNVILSALAGVVAIIVAITTGESWGFLVGVGFLGMCVFAFVPIMRRAQRYEREKQSRADVIPPDTK